MRKFSRFLLSFGVLQGAFFSFSASASALETAERWLNEYVSKDDRFSVALTKNKIRFKGCKQKQYQFVLNQKFTDSFNVQAIVHYNKGLLNYGVLTQRVKSHEYELVSWWDRGDYRVGLSHKIRPQHEISIPIADTIQLPTSITSGIYVEIPFVDAQHTLTIAALRESWAADDASMRLPWRTSHDSQVQLQYAIAF